MIRNLIYHVTPMGNWKENIRQLLHRFTVFNGVKIIAIAQGDLLQPIENVKAAFERYPEVKFITVKNDSLLRETASFLPLLTELKNTVFDTYDKSVNVTFYGHTKGVTHTSNRAIKLWTRGCYIFNLDNIPEVERQLSWFPIVGSFKRYIHHIKFPPGSRDWHYSGTFFWFKNHEVFNRDWQGSLKPHRYGVEAWPSFLFKPTEGGVLFGDGIGDMYDLRYVRDLYKREGIRWAE